MYILYFWGVFSCFHLLIMIVILFNDLPLPFIRKYGQIKCDLELLNVFKVTHGVEK